MAPSHSSLLLGLLTVPLASALMPLSMLRRSPQKQVRAYFRREDSTSALSIRLAAILKHNPSLQKPRYVPTPWARGSKANFALALARSRLGALRRRVEPPLTGRVTTCDSPDVTIEWAKDDAALALPADAPVVIFLHTITGSAAQTRWQMGQASARGWRSCTFVRRGHGDAMLTSPTFNLLGDVGDTELQVSPPQRPYLLRPRPVSDAATPSVKPGSTVTTLNLTPITPLLQFMQVAAVRRTYPDAFLGMVGVSAGSGLLVSYLGRAGASTPIGAACAICPAWDVSVAFDNLAEEEPETTKLMIDTIKAKFVTRNVALLRAWDPAATAACLAAETMPQMLAAHAPFAMRDRTASVADYFAAHNPMEYRKGVAVPTLLLNAEDDFVCPARNVRPELVAQEQPGTLLLVTRSGSHCAFNEGVLGGGSFHTRISFDFLDAAKATAGAAVTEAMPESVGRASERVAVVGN